MTCHARFGSSIREGPSFARRSRADPRHKDEKRGSERHDSLLHRLTLHPAYANIGMYQRMKSLTWLADSRSNVKSFPAGVKHDRGYAVYAAQLGARRVNGKP